MVDVKPLVVLPPLPIRLLPSRRVVITHKYVEGMRRYGEEWGGPITSIMEPTDVGTTNLDEFETDPADLPFRLIVSSFHDPEIGRLIAEHSLAVCALDYRQPHLAKVCRSVGVPCVWISEFSLRTRCEIILSETRNPIISLKRQFFEYLMERQFREAVALSAGIQCNGTPTFEAYRKISPNPFLFFDTRGTEEMVITPAELEKRGATLLQGGPLRLMFSGRLIEMKGADHLVKVAASLRELGVPFRMTICGDGILAGRMKADIDRLNLSDLVEMTGTLDFRKVLVPLTKEQTDLFVCCHRSGDPSGTYLEVMSCGVPIVGYDNDALVGIVREAGAGWATPMNRPEKLSEKIAEIAKDRAGLLKAAKTVAEFALKNNFDRTYKRRIAHMKSCARSSLATSTVG